MKIGIISDIHGNLRALDAVLEAFRARGVDDIICLGDMIGYFHQSIEVLDRIMGFDIRCIMGNHEAYLLGIEDCLPEKWDAYLLESLKRKVKTKHLEWLSGLPKTMEFDVGDRKIAFFHGSPWDPLEEYIYPDSDKLGFFSTLHWNYVFLGHTHYRMQKKAGRVNIVNPGSCGLPRDGGSGASAVIYDPGSGEIQFINESYDVASTAEEARLAGVYPEAIRKLEQG